MRLVLLGSILLLAGCGSGGDEAPVSKTPDPPATEQQQAARNQASQMARGQAESYKNQRPAGG